MNGILTRLTKLKSDSSKADLKELFSWILLMTVLSYVEILWRHRNITACWKMGPRLAAALTHLIYRKTLRLKNSVLSAVEIDSYRGTEIEHLSNDTLPSSGGTLQWSTPMSTCNLTGEVLEAEQTSREPALISKSILS